jgi:penicillin-binding protein 1A
MPSGMISAWINPNSGVKAFEGEAAIKEAFKPGTGPNQMTSVIGIDVNAYDAAARQQMMQQQYGGGITQPSNNGTFMDPTVRRRTIF